MKDRGHNASSIYIGVSFCKGCERKQDATSMQAVYSGVLVYHFVRDGKDRGCHINASSI